MEKRRLTMSPIGAIALAALISLAAGARADSRDRSTPPRGRAYQQTNLVSDIEGVAQTTDPNLVNPWGIAINPSGPIWVSNADSGTSTLYDGDGNILPSEAAPLVVSIPAPPGSPAGSVGAPTGIVFNGGAGFVVSAGGKSGPSRFVYATEDGTVVGWSPAVDRTHAILAYDDSTTGAIYKGMAMANTSSGDRLYVTDFHGGSVDVLDSNFQPVSLPGGFTDPNLPAGYAPFGIANVNGSLVVTYAKQDEHAEDDAPGPGFGYVDVYDVNGQLQRRFASNGVLNAPWGVALAPKNFGPMGGSLLIGNFGDGRINAFNPVTGASLGPLMNERGRPFDVNGLWGLAFGPITHGRDRNEATLFFTAGIADESHGLLGKITVGH